MPLPLRLGALCAVLLASSACSGGGASGGGTDAGDGGNGVNGNGADVDASGGVNGGDDGGGNGGSDGGDNATNNGGTDAGPDGGSDAGDGGPIAFSCSNSGTALTAAGGEVVSDDGKLRLVLSAGALSQNTSIKVCAVPEADWPDAAASDGTGPVSAVYRVEPVDLTFSAATSANLTVDGAVLTSITGANGLAPLTLHRLPEAGAAARLTNVQMRLGTAPLLTGGVAGGGHVYARHVDDSGARYAVEVVTSGGALSKLTGEVFDLGSKVTVSGTPLVVRPLSLRLLGCDLEPLQPTGVEQSREQGVGCEIEPILREGTALTAAGDSLSADSSIDLKTGGSDVDATHLPPRLFCTLPGPASARLELGFGAGSDRAVTVVAEQSVTCTPSGDRLGALELRRANRNQHGPVIPTVWPFGTPVHVSDVRVSNAATIAQFQALGGDGWFAATVPTLASENLFASFDFLTEDTGGGDINALAMTFDDPSDSYFEDGYGDPSFRFYTDAGGRVSVEDPGVGTSTLSADVTGFDDIDLRFGASGNANTQISFANGTVDAVVISGFDRVNPGDPLRLRFERWLRPSDLPLVQGRRSTPLLTAAQQTQLQTAGTTITSYSIALINASWDEDRILWSGGRVLPVVGGHLVNVFADRIDPALVPASPCPAVVTNGSNGCQTGPYETLLVATSSGIQAFDPVTGKRLGKAFDGTASDRNGFRHVIPGADGCLYASQHDDDVDGVYRYRPTTTGIAALDADGTPYFSVDEPYGLGFLDTGELLVASGAEPVQSFASNAPDNYGTQDVANTRGLLVYPTRPMVPAGIVLVSQRAGALGAQTVALFPPTADAQPPVQWLSGLTQPEQVAADAADAPNILVAQASGVLKAYRFPSGNPLTYTSEIGSPAIEYEYSDTEAPQGVWPLLNDGHWLVAGEDMGVDVVVPGSLVKTATATTFADDAYYVSRVCLPFDPAP